MVRFSSTTPASCGGDTHSSDDSFTLSAGITDAAPPNWQCDTPSNAVPRSTRRLAPTLGPTSGVTLLTTGTLKVSARGGELVLSPLARRRLSSNAPRSGLALKSEAAGVWQ